MSEQEPRQTQGPTGGTEGAAVRVEAHFIEIIHQREEQRLRAMEAEAALRAATARAERAELRLIEARRDALLEAAAKIKAVIEMPVGYENAVSEAINQLEDAGAEWPHAGVFRQAVELIIDEASGKVCDEFRAVWAALERMAAAASPAATPDTDTGAAQ